MSEFKYEIINTYGVISESSRGWTKELKLISWNEREPRFDIREWSPESDKMGRGITMRLEEIVKLKSLLETLDLNMAPAHVQEEALQS